MTQPLYLKWHLGLGDALLCNGLVRVLNKTFENIVLPAWAHNIETVRFMFRDLPGITVVPVDFDGMNDFGKGERIMKLGHYAEAIEGYAPFDPAKFDQEFYRQSGVDFECRWSMFKADWAERKDVLGIHPMAFLHEDEERGFKINKQCIYDKFKGQVYLPNKSGAKTFWDNVWCLQLAKEVHCINSSFLILADSLPEVPGQKLFLHHYARPTDYPILKKEWIVLKHNAPINPLWINATHDIEFNS